MANETNEIKQLLLGTEEKEIPFWHLVVVKEADEEDEAPWCVNEVALKGDKVMCYDRTDEDENGEFDPIWDVEELPSATKKELLWAVQNTRETLCA